MGGRYRTCVTRIFEKLFETSIVHHPCVNDIIPVFVHARLNVLEPPETLDLHDYNLPRIYDLEPSIVRIEFSSYVRKIVSQEKMRSLAVFDFDHTITDDNTDTVARSLLPEEKLTDDVKKLYHTHGWTVYMGKIMELLHASSIDAKQIENAIVGIPAVPGVEELLRGLHRLEYEIIIISDSNSIFIDRWLKSRKLDKVVTEVFTNPARIEPDGMIKLDMYHVQDTCKLSEINLCKGRVLEDYVEKRSNQGIRFERIVYVGDGKNDLCPVLRLSENDIAFPRIGYALAKLLNDGESRKDRSVRAKVIPWRDGFDILKNLDEKSNV